MHFKYRLQKAAILSRGRWVKYGMALGYDMVHWNFMFAKAIQNLTIQNTT